MNQHSSESQTPQGGREAAQQFIINDMAGEEHYPEPPTSECADRSAAQSQIINDLPETQTEVHPAQSPAGNPHRKTVEQILRDLDQMPDAFANPQVASPPQSSIVNDLPEEPQPAPAPVTSRSQPLVINDPRENEALTQEWQEQQQAAYAQQQAAYHQEQPAPYPQEPPAQYQQEQPAPTYHEAAPANYTATPDHAVAHQQAEYEAPPQNTEPVEEIDMWWGGYSSWALLPSWLLCVGLTAVAVLAIDMFVPRDLHRLAGVGSVGAIWLLQLTRWLYRFFGVSYRLTTRRLYAQHGWLYAELQRIERTEIKAVTVEIGSWARVFGVGNVIVESTVDKREPLVIEGIRGPEQLARQLRGEIEDE